MARQGQKIRRAPPHTSSEDTSKGAPVEKWLPNSQTTESPGCAERRAREARQLDLLQPRGFSQLPHLSPVSPSPVSEHEPSRYMALYLVAEFHFRIFVSDLPRASGPSPTRPLAGLGPPVPPASRPNHIQPTSQIHHRNNTQSAELCDICCWPVKHDGRFIPF